MSLDFPTRSARKILERIIPPPSGGRDEFRFACFTTALCAWYNSSSKLRFTLFLKLGSHFQRVSLHHLYRSSPLNDSHQHYDNGNDQQDMNKITYRIARHQPQRPQNYQYHSDCPQHMILLSDCSFPLPARASCTNRQWEYSIFVFELVLIDGHPVIYTFHSVYIVGKFGSQIHFGSAFRLTTQRDHAVRCLD